MSLLLDALNRASKDKANAAAATQAASAASAADAALAPPPTTPASPGDGVSGLPVLELSLASAERTPAQVDPWQTEQAVAATEQPLLAPFVLTEPVQAAKPSGSTPEPVAPGPQSAPAPSPNPAPTPPSKPAASGAPRVAQDIVRAKAPATRTKPPLRLVILGSLAAVLAVGLGSVLLGVWGDPSNWIQSSGLAGSSTVAPVVARAVEPVTAAPAPALETLPAASQAPVAPDGMVVHDASNRPLVHKAAASPTAGPATSEPPDTVVSAPPAPAAAAAKPAMPPKAAPALVQSRTAGPSTLEVAYAALLQGRWPEAAQAYEQALLANPDERDALLGLAYIAHQQGQPDEARGYYQRVLRHDPGNVSARSGLLAINAIDDPQALASRAREVAEQNPDSAAAQSTLGHAMAREGRLADAQQAFFRAHSLEPAVALHAFNLAVALDRLRQYGPARQYYERALALSAQSGAERASGVPQAVVQTRLGQLRAAQVANPLGAARE